jgi:Ca-activated chloride channel family protein
MNGLSFESPRFLLALLIFAPLIPLGIFRRRALKARFPGGKSLGRRVVLSDLFFGLFLASLILALAGPRWGSRTVAEYYRGLDVVFALDLSRSMEIRDVPASGGGELSRLDRGLELVRDAAALPGCRFAAALGKGRGLLAAPLTGDTETLRALLDGLGGPSLTGRGTNLEALIDAAASAFETPFPARRLIVLVSDGEALSGSLRAALDRLRDGDIILTALGLGSDEGSPVPAEAGAGEAGAGEAGAETEAAAGAAAKAETGEPPLLSRRRAGTLRQAAELTGGIYIDGNGSRAADLLGEHLRALGPETRAPGSRREPKPRQRLFVIAALLAFGASKLCMVSRRRRGLAAVLLALLCSCSPAPGKLLIIEGNFLYARTRYDEAAAAYLRAPDKGEAAPYAAYGLGTVYISQGEGEAALERYAAAEKHLEALPEGEHRELRFRIPYNRGQVHFDAGDYGAAAAAFRAALEIDGRRIEAKRNLELSLLSLARKQEEAGRRRDESPGEAGAALFNYLRMKERNQWKSREWAEEESPPGPDY